MSDQNLCTDPQSDEGQWILLFMLMRMSMKPLNATQKVTDRLFGGGTHIQIIFYNSSTFKIQ